MFNTGIEMLIIKYAIGGAFVILIVSFGVKLLILLSMVAKIKLLGLLEGLKSVPFLYEGIKTLLERGTIK